MPATIGTSEDNSPTLKNWKDKKILDDEGCVALEKKRISTPLSRNYEDYSANGDNQNLRQTDQLQIVPDYLKNSPYGQGK